MTRPSLRPEERKIRITIRLDRAVVEYFRSTGRGWQTRISDALDGIVKRKLRAKGTPR